MLGPTLLALALSPSMSPAQPDAARLLRAIERLEASARVLYVAAHPDDENTALLAWLVHARKMEAAYLSITRGDGGQNLIGPEQGPALGLLRTHELLAARRSDGAGQFFTRARDFGYSKSVDEASRLWGKVALADVVWVYRTFRPDVVVTRFHPDHLETHGQHVASARLAVEALEKAGDPSFLPQQLTGGVTPWKPKRVVWNKSAFFVRPGEDLSKYLKEDIGGWDALLGASMGELSAQSRNMHKSQGFGMRNQRGEVVEYFEVVAGQPAQGSFLEGVASELPDGEYRRAVRKLRAAYRMDAPHESVPALVELLRIAPEAARPEIQELIAAAAGLYLGAYADRHAVSPGKQLEVSIEGLQRAPAGLELEGVKLATGEHESVVPRAWQQGRKMFKAKLQLGVPPSMPISDPEWLNIPQEGHYPVELREDRVRPEPPPALWAEFALRAGDTKFTLRRPLLFRWTDPIHGERTRAAIVVPPVTVDAAAPTLMLVNDGVRSLRVRVRAADAPVEGQVRALVAKGSGYAIEPSEQPFKLEKGGEAELHFAVRSEPGAQPRDVQLVANVGGVEWDRGLRKIDYPHVPPQEWHPRAKVRFARVDLKRGPARVGYLHGAGDDVPQALAQVGYTVVQLDEGALRDGDLGTLDAIVLGVRAFNVHAWLPPAMPRVLAWVERGGTLLVQYQVQNRISKLSGSLGPYPLSIGQDRVTDEKSPVVLALPQHAALRTPNAIGPKDFEGWIQERGLYFAGKWDDKYESPLAMSDPNEPARRGSLLVARHGKGRYVYTGLAFFRQLPAGVPGAFRLFANLLARDGDAL